MDGYTSEESQSAPPLRAYAPTSQLAAARKSSPQQRKPQALRPAGLQPMAWQSSAASSLPPIVTVDPRVANDAVENGSVFSGSLGVIRSLLVSTTLHLILLLSLAYLGFRSGDSNTQVILEFSEIPAVEMMKTEIEFQAIAVDDPVELELVEQTPSESDSLDLEFPTIPLEMMEFVNLKNLFESGDEVLGDLEREFGVGEGNGSGNGAGEKPSGGAGAKFFGVNSNGTRFVFVIDCSGSMSGRRWYRAVKELNTAIDELGVDQQFLVLLYNSGTYVMMDRILNEARLVRATEENKVDFRRWLRRQHTQGGTFPSKAMYAALRLYPDAIFLLSDGELQDGTQQLLPRWNVAVLDSDQSRPRIPIHTISLGRSRRGQETLKAIARQNDGNFTLAK